MKKYLITIAAVFSPVIAFAQTTTIALPSDFNANIWGNVTSIITALAPFIELILGVILAAVVIEVIIGALKK